MVLKVVSSVMVNCLLGHGSNPRNSLLMQNKGKLHKLRPFPNLTYGGSLVHYDIVLMAENGIAFKALKWS